MADNNSSMVAVVAVVAVVILAGAALYFLFLKGDARAPATQTPAVNTEIKAPDVDVSVPSATEKKGE